MIFVSFADPGGDLVDDCLFVGDAPVETLRGEDAEFGFGQVQPGAVFRRVMPFEAFDQTPGLGGGKGFVERRGGVGVKVVLDEDDRLGLREVDIGQVSQNVGVIDGGAAVGDRTSRPDKPAGGRGRTASCKPTARPPSPLRTRRWPWAG